MIVFCKFNEYFIYPAFISHLHMSFKENFMCFFHIVNIFPWNLSCKNQNYLKIGSLLFIRDFFAGKVRENLNKGWLNILHLTSKAGSKFTIGGAPVDRLSIGSGPDIISAAGAFRAQTRSQQLTLDYRPQLHNYQVGYEMSVFQ